MSYEESYQPFLRALAGVIFLGTPHSREEDETQWQKAGMTMPAISKRKRSISSDDVAQLANSSKLFEQTPVKVPILSIHETKETKVKTGFVASKKTLVINIGLLCVCVKKMSSILT